MTDVAAPVAFGPYLLVRASGALGRLEMAVRTDVRDPEVCVLKRLPIRALAADAAARFRRQAQLAARLEHENVARTLRVETIEGQVCVARELIDGMTLSKVMRALGAQPAPLIATLHVVHQMARGLAYAHDLSIVHGEVAPENVMIAFSGQVKLIDFGIGRPAGDAEPAQTGVVVGHRGFLPPEAAELHEPDRAGDIYGLGVVLWELLTGHRADDAQEIPLPDVRTLNPDVPDELARIVARATALAPQDRPGGADELGAALTTFLPASTDPQQATAALLRSCFDVDTLQPLLAADLAAAKRLVTGEPSETETPPRATTPMRLSAPPPGPPGGERDQHAHPAPGSGTAFDPCGRPGRRRLRDRALAPSRREPLSIDGCRGGGRAPARAAGCCGCVAARGTRPARRTCFRARATAAGYGRGDAASLPPRARGPVARRPRRRRRAAAATGE